LGIFKRIECSISIVIAIIFLIAMSVCYVNSNTFLKRARSTPISYYPPKTIEDYFPKAE